jgi:hypothetical protein
LLEAIALIAALTATAPAEKAKLSLKPVTLQAIAGDTEACLRHVTTKGMDRAGLEAEGWVPHPPSDLPERPFSDSVTLYGRGDGMVLAYVGTSKDTPTACVVVALPAQGPDLNAVGDQLTAALKIRPDNETADRKTWTSKFISSGIPDGVFVVLSKDQQRADLINVITSAVPHKPPTSPSKN